MERTQAQRMRRAVPGVLLVLWLAPTAVALWLTGGWQAAGAVGDSFGVANSLFSGLALLGVLYTIWQQQRSFEDQAAQSAAERQAARDQVLQLVLSTQLQTARALLAEHRKALVELSPAIKDVPTAPTLLQALRKQVISDTTMHIISPGRSTDIIQNIDELVELQEEIVSIRQALKARHDAPSGQQQ